MLPKLILYDRPFDKHFRSTLCHTFRLFRRRYRKLVQAKVGIIVRVSNEEYQTAAGRDLPQRQHQLINLGLRGHTPTH